MKKYAFFDVDNTIYDGYTAEDFIIFSVSNSFIGSNILKEYKKLRHFYISGEKDYNEIAQLGLNLVSRALKDKERTEVENLSSKLISNKKRLFFPGVKKFIDYLKKSEFEIILVSAGPDFLIEKIQKEIKAQRAFATDIISKNNYYTGEEVIVLNDKQKIGLIKDIISEEETISVGFGDSLGDVPFLKIVDKAFMFLSKRNPEAEKFSNDLGFELFSDYVKLRDDFQDFRIG